jgi:hypothetical protein
VEHVGVWPVIRRNTAEIGKSAVACYSVKEGSRRRIVQCKGRKARQSWTFTQTQMQYPIHPFDHDLSSTTCRVNFPCPIAVSWHAREVAHRKTRKGCPPRYEFVIRYINTLPSATSCISVTSLHHLPFHHPIQYQRMLAKSLVVPLLAASSALAHYTLDYPVSITSTGFGLSLADDVCVGQSWVH